MKQVLKVIWERHQFPYGIWLQGALLALGVFIGGRSPEWLITYGVTIGALAWCVAGLVLMLRSWAVRHGNQAQDV